VASNSAERRTKLMGLYGPKNVLVALQTRIHDLCPELDEVYLNPTSPNPEVPYCIITDVSNIPEHYFGVDNDTFYMRIQIDVYTRREHPIDSLWATGEKIYRALNKQFLTVSDAGYVNLLSLTRGSPRAENDALSRITYQFQLLGTEVN
jgi:hypothetical protein